MSKMVRLANASRHWQTQNLDVFQQWGLEVDPEPLLRIFSGYDDPVKVARDAVATTLRRGYDGVFVAGRTDVSIATAILAAQAGLQVWTPDTDFYEPGRFTKFKYRLKSVRRLPIRTENGRIYIGPDDIAEEVAAVDAGAVPAKPKAAAT